MRLRRPAVALATAIACILLTSCGPRMRVQQSVQPFEQDMPAMPPASVPTTGRLDTHAREQSRLTSNPLAVTPANLRSGRVHYDYYCRACHGVKGDGNGPVGESYVPKPTDLRSAAVARMTDGELYYRMLHGAGHDPVMPHTVAPDQRWPIVMYVRSLGRNAGEISP